MKFIGLFFIAILLHQYSVAQKAKYQGQGPIQRVVTKTKPTQPQWKGVFELPSKVYASNNFQGGRLNGIVQTEGDTLVALITPENTPINPSAWYAFKIWSTEAQEVTMKLTYQDSRHRYYPKLSRDGVTWTPIDSANYEDIGKGDALFGPGAQSDAAVLHLAIGTDTLWVAAQELKTSKHVFGWMDKMAEKKFSTVEEIGKSREGRPMKCLKVGKSDDKKMILVISRQHPPEVTGYLAMKAFVETLAGNSRWAKKFRKEYNVYVVPLMNPDGVDSGHWRHSKGGVDLNRDWADFNQAETAAVRNFMQQKVEATGGKFYFGIDFHSTWDDIYYTIPPNLKSNLTGFTSQWLEAVKAELPNYEPNIRPTTSLEPTLVSRNYFFVAHGAEALVYEVGDNTPRDFVKKKGQVSAEQLMKIVLKEY